MRLINAVMCCLSICFGIGIKDLIDTRSGKGFLEVAKEQEPKTDVLDKIRAEIEEKIIPSTLGGKALKQDCLTIIDRYKDKGVEK